MKHAIYVSVVLFSCLLTMTTAAQQQPGRTFTDTKGHTLSVPLKPMRIASVVLGVDENLLDLVDPSRIVTMTEISKDIHVSNVATRVPPQTKLIKDKWQDVIDLKPDLVQPSTRPLWPIL